MLPSTSKLASERHKAQEHGRVQQAKFSDAPRSFELPEHSHSWQQLGNQTSDDYQSHSGSQAGMIGSGVNREGAGRAEYTPRTAAWWGEGTGVVFKPQQLSKEGTSG